jgi:hypothetical protein
VDGAWVGRVIYALPDAGAARPVERWVPARHLEPTESGGGPSASPSSTSRTQRPAG